MAWIQQNPADQSWVERQNQNLLPLTNFWGAGYIIAEEQGCSLTGGEVWGPNPQAQLTPGMWAQESQHSHDCSISLQGQPSSLLLNIKRKRADILLQKALCRSASDQVTDVSSCFRDEHFSLSTYSNFFLFILLCIYRLSLLILTKYII